MDREDALARINNLIRHNARQNALQSDEEADSDSDEKSQKYSASTSFAVTPSSQSGVTRSRIAGSASPAYSEIGPAVPDTSCMPQVTRASTRGRPVTDGVDMNGLSTKQLRAIKGLGTTLIVGPPTNFARDQEYPSSLAFMYAAVGSDNTGSSEEEDKWINIPHTYKDAISYP